MVNFILQHGNSEVSSIVFIYFANYLIIERKDHKSAVEFCKIGKQLVEAYQNTEIQIIFYTLYGAILGMYIESVSECIKYLQKANTLGVECGTLRYACYSVMSLPAFYSLTDMNLPAVIEIIKPYMVFLKRYNPYIYNYTLCQTLAIYTLSDTPIQFDESTYLQNFGKIPICIGAYYYSKIITCFMLDVPDKSWIELGEAALEFISRSFTGFCLEWQGKYVVSLMHMAIYHLMEQELQVKCLQCNCSIPSSKSYVICRNPSS